MKLTGVSRPDRAMAAADVCLEINPGGKEKEITRWGQEKGNKWQGKE